MRVAMYYNNNDVRIEEMPVPDVGPGELLLKIEASSICGSDVMEWYRVQRAPVVLGHEVAGSVAQTGAGVSQYREGDRLVVTHHVPCNACRYCLSGSHTVCDTLRSTNYDPGWILRVREASRHQRRPRSFPHTRRRCIRRSLGRRAAGVRLPGAEARQHPAGPDGARPRQRSCWNAPHKPGPGLGGWPHRIHRPVRLPTRGGSRAGRRRNVAGR